MKNLTQSIMTLSSKRLPAAVLTIIIILGLVDAWSGRRSYVAGDTISYMDMASGLAGGDPSYAVNGHFSPLYPIVLSLFIWPFQSDSFVEFCAVRAVNFLIFVGVIFIFRAFLARFFDQYYRHFGSTTNLEHSLSRSHFTAIAFIILAWGCFGLTMVSRINPDMCVVGTTFAAAAIVLSFKQGHVSPIRFLAFGAVLGIGYLFKAIFFPMSFVFIAAAALEPRVWAVKMRLTLTLAMFFLVASPLIAALSVKYGHLTYGESGKLSYWTEVLQENRGTPSYVHWQGDPPESGVPEHPTRKIFQDPDIYEFASPIVSTYPPWFGTTYWNAGAKVRFDVRKQALAIANNLKNLAKILWMLLPLTILLIVYRCRASWSSIRYFQSLWLICVANVGIYLLVVIDGRYLAGCLPILAIISLAAVRIPNSARSVGPALIALLAICVTVQCGPRLARAATVLVSTHGVVRDDRWLVAEEFERMNIQAGTPVAAIDYQQGFQYWPAALIGDWARLARVRIVSEIVQTSGDRTQFWQASPDRQALALQALGATGARFVVASGVPDGATTAGWTRIQNSRYYYRSLQ
jgi:hypothetical protein